MTDQLENHDETTALDDIHQFVVSKAKFRLGKDGATFPLSVVASFVKCYEFNQMVRDSEQERHAFFWLSALRSICEDVIYLNFLNGLPEIDRDVLIAKLVQHETLERIQLQSRFFARTRPIQPVLGLNQSLDAPLTELSDEIRFIWSKHGFNLTKTTKPQTRQIAEKQGEPILLNLYDFLYRLTSGAVHFNAHALFRMAWGNNLDEFVFSTTNFSQYYVSYSRVYGAFLLLLYYDLFEDVIGDMTQIEESLAKIRRWLLMHPRWPEMVTFEEMNLDAPSFHNFLVVLKAILDENSSQHLLDLLHHTPAAQ